MVDLYERQYRKIVDLASLADGTRATFETGGTRLQVTRNGDRVVASEIISNVAAGGANESGNELPAEVRDGWVWVCIDLCS